MSMVYYSCNGCQWENDCEFNCPCEHYCGNCEVDDEIDYAVATFEMIEAYNDVENQFNNDCR